MRSKFLLNNIFLIFLICFNHISSKTFDLNVNKLSTLSLSSEEPNSELRILVNKDTKLRLIVIPSRQSDEVLLKSSQLYIDKAFDFYNQTLDFNVKTNNDYQLIVSYKSIDESITFDLILIDMNDLVDNQVTEIETISLSEGERKLNITPTELINNTKVFKIIIKNKDLLKNLIIKSNQKKEIKVNISKKFIPVLESKENTVLSSKINVELSKKDFNLNENENETDFIVYLSLKFSQIKKITYELSFFINNLTIFGNEIKYDETKNLYISASIKINNLNQADFYLKLDEFSQDSELIRQDIKILGSTSKGDVTYLGSFTNKDPEQKDFPIKSNDPNIIWNNDLNLGTFKPNINNKYIIFSLKTTKIIGFNVQIEVSKRPVLLSFSTEGTDFIFSDSILLSSSILTRFSFQNMNIFLGKDYNTYIFIKTKVKLRIILSPITYQSFVVDDNNVQVFEKIVTNDEMSIYKINFNEKVLLDESLYKNLYFNLINVDSAKVSFEIRVTKDDFSQNQSFGLMLQSNLIKKGTDSYIYLDYIVKNSIVFFEQLIENDNLKVSYSISQINLKEYNSLSSIRELKYLPLESNFYISDTSLRIIFKLSISDSSFLNNIINASVGNILYSSSMIYSNEPAFFNIPITDQGFSFTFKVNKKNFRIEVFQFSSTDIDNETEVKLSNSEKVYSLKGQQMISDVIINNTEVDCYLTVKGSKDTKLKIIFNEKIEKISSLELENKITTGFYYLKLNKSKDGYDYNTVIEYKDVYINSILISMQEDEGEVFSFPSNKLSSIGDYSLFSISSFLEYENSIKGNLFLGLDLKSLSADSSIKINNSILQKIQPDQNSPVNFIKLSSDLYFSITKTEIPNAKYYTLYVIFNPSSKNSKNIFTKIDTSIFTIEKHETDQFNNGFLYVSDLFSSAPSKINFYIKNYINDTTDDDILLFMKFYNQIPIIPKVSNKLTVDFTYLENKLDFNLRWNSLFENDPSRYVIYYVYLNDKIKNKNKSYSNLYDILKDKDQLFDVTTKITLLNNEYYSYDLLHDTTIFDAYVIALDVESGMYYMYNPIENFGFCRKFFESNQDYTIKFTNFIGNIKVCAYKQASTNEINVVSITESSDFPVDESVSLEIYEVNTNNLLKSIKNIEKEVIEYKLIPKNQFVICVFTNNNRKKEIDTVFNIIIYNFNDTNTANFNGRIDNIMFYKLNSSSYMKTIKFIIPNEAITNNFFRLQAYSDKTNLKLELYGTKSDKPLRTYNSITKSEGIESDSYKQNTELEGDYYFLVKASNEDLSDSVVTVSLLLVSEIYTDDNKNYMIYYPYQNQVFHLRSIINKRHYIVFVNHSNEAKYISFLSKSIYAIGTDLSIDKVEMKDFPDKSTENVIIGKESLLLLPSNSDYRLFLISIDFQRDDLYKNIFSDFIVYTNKGLISDVKLNEDTVFDLELSYSSPYLYQITDIKFLINFQKLQFLSKVDYFLENNSDDKCKLTFSLGMNSVPFRFYNEGFIYNSQQDFEIELKKEAKGIYLNMINFDVNSLRNSLNPTYFLTIFSECKCNSLFLYRQHNESTDVKYSKVSLSKTEVFIKHPVFIDKTKEEYVYFQFEENNQKEVLVSNRDLQNNVEICYKYINSTVKPSIDKSLFDSVFDFEDCIKPDDNSLFILKFILNQDVIIKLKVDEEYLRTTKSIIIFSYIDEISNENPIDISFYQPRVLRMKTEKSYFNLLKYYSWNIGRNVRLVIRGINIKNNLIIRINNEKHTIIDRTTFYIDLNNTDYKADVYIQDKNEIDDNIFLVEAYFNTFNYSVLDLNDESNSSNSDVFVYNPYSKGEFTIVFNVNIRNPYIRLNLDLSNVSIVEYSYDIVKDFITYSNDLLLNPNKSLLSYKIHSKNFEFKDKDLYTSYYLIVYLKLDSSLNKDSRVNFSYGDYDQSTVESILPFEFLYSKQDLMKKILLPDFNEDEKIILNFHKITTSNQSMKSNQSDELINTCVCLSSFSSQTILIENINFSQTDQQIFLPLQSETSQENPSILVSCQYGFEVIISHFIIKKSESNPDYSRHILPGNSELSIKRLENESQCSEDLVYKVNVDIIPNDSILKPQYYIYYEKYSQTKGNKGNISFSQFLSLNNTILNIENSSAEAILKLNPDTDYSLSVIYFDSKNGVMRRYKNKEIHTEKSKINEKIMLKIGEISRIDYMERSDCDSLVYSFRMNIDKVGKYLLVISSFDYIDYILTSDIKEIDGRTESHIIFEMNSDFPMGNKDFSVKIKNIHSSFKGKSFNLVLLSYNDEPNQIININQNTYVNSLLIKGKTIFDIENKEKTIVHLDLILKSNSTIDEIDLIYGTNTVTRSVNKSTFEETFSDSSIPNRIIIRKNQISETETQVEVQFIMYYSQVRVIKLNSSMNFINLLSNNLLFNFYFNFSEDFNNNLLYQELRLSNARESVISKAKVLDRPIEETDFPIKESDKIIDEDGQRLRITYQNRLTDYYIILTLQGISYSSNKSLVIEISNTQILVNDLGLNSNLLLKATSYTLNTIKITDVNSLLLYNHVYIMSSSKNSLFIKSTTEYQGCFINEVKSFESLNDQVIETYKSLSDDIRIYEILINQSIIRNNSLYLYISLSSQEDITEDIVISLLPSNDQFYEASYIFDNELNRSILLQPSSKAYIVYKATDINKPTSLLCLSEIINVDSNTEELNRISLSFSNSNEISHLKNGFFSLENDFLYRKLLNSYDFITVQIGNILLFKLENKLEKTVIYNLHISKVNENKFFFFSNDFIQSFDLTFTDSIDFEFNGESQITTRILSNSIDKGEIEVKYSDTEKEVYELSNTPIELMTLKKRGSILIKRKSFLKKNQKFLVLIRGIKSKDNIIMINNEDSIELSDRSNLLSGLIPISHVNNSLKIGFSLEETDIHDKYDTFSLEFRLKSTFKSEKVRCFFSEFSNIGTFKNVDFAYDFINFDENLVKDLLLSMSIFYSKSNSELIDRNIKKTSLIVHVDQSYFIKNTKTETVLKTSYGIKALSYEKINFLSSENLNDNDYFLFQMFYNEDTETVSNLEIISEIPSLILTRYQLISSNLIKNNKNYKSVLLNKGNNSKDFNFFYTVLSTPVDLNKYKDNRQIKSYSIKEGRLNIVYDTLILNDDENQVEYNVKLYNKHRFNVTNPIDAFFLYEKADYSYSFTNQIDVSVDISSISSSIYFIFILAQDKSSSLMKIYDNSPSQLICSKYYDYNQSTFITINSNDNRSSACFIIESNQNRVELNLYNYSRKDYEYNNNIEVNIYLGSERFTFKNKLDIGFLVPEQEKKSQFLSVLVEVILIKTLPQQSSLSFMMSLHNQENPIDIDTNQSFEYEINKEFPNKKVKSTVENTKLQVFSENSEFSLVVYDKNMDVKYESEIVPVGIGIEPSLFISISDLVVIRPVFSLSSSSSSSFTSRKLFKNRELTENHKETSGIIRLVFQKYSENNKNFIEISDYNQLLTFKQGYISILPSKEFLIAIRSELIVINNSKVYSTVLYSDSDLSIIAKPNNKPIETLTENDFPTRTTEGIFIGEENRIYVSSSVNTSDEEFNKEFLLFRAVFEPSSLNNNKFSLRFYSKPKEVKELNTLTIDKVKFNDPQTYILSIKDYIIDYSSLYIYSKDYSPDLRIAFSYNFQPVLIDTSTETESKFMFKGDSQNLYDYSECLFNRIEIDQNRLFSKAESVIYLTFFNINHESTIDSEVSLSYLTNEGLSVDNSQTRSIQINLEKKSKLHLHIRNTNENKSLLNIFLNQFSGQSDKKGIELKVKPISKYVIKTSILHIKDLFYFESVPIFEEFSVSLEKDEDLLVEISNLNENNENFISFFMFGEAISGNNQNSTDNPLNANDQLEIDINKLAFISFSNRLELKVINSKAVIIPTSVRYLFAKGSINENSLSISIENEEEIIVNKGNTVINEKISSQSKVKKILFQQDGINNIVIFIGLSLLKTQISDFVPSNNSIEIMSSTVDFEKILLFSLLKDEKTNENTAFSYNLNMVGLSVVGYITSFTYELYELKENQYDIFNMINNLESRKGLSKYNNIQIRNIPNKNYVVLLKITLSQVNRNEFKRLITDVYNGLGKSFIHKEAYLNEINFSAVAVQENEISINNTETSRLLEVSLYKPSLDCVVSIKELGYLEKISQTKSRTILSLPIQKSISKVNLKVLCRRREDKENEIIAFITYAFVEEDYKNQRFEIGNSKFNYSYEATGETNTYSLFIKEYEKIDFNKAEMEYFGVIRKKGSEDKPNPSLDLYSYLYNQKDYQSIYEENNQIKFTVFSSIDYEVYLFGHDKHSGVYLSYDSSVLKIKPDQGETSIFWLYLIFIVIGGVVVITAVLYLITKYYNSQFNKENQLLDNENKTSENAINKNLVEESKRNDDV